MIASSAIVDNDLPDLDCCAWALWMRGKVKKEKKKKKICECVLCGWREHTGVVFNERRKHVRVLDDIPVWALIHTNPQIQILSTQYSIRKSQIQHVRKDEASDHTRNILIQQRLHASPV